MTVLPHIVCLIDDDDIYQFTFLKSLAAKSENRKVITFSDGEEALNFMNENLLKPDVLPDIIFLDINMPVMDGWEFLEEFVKIKPHTGKEITIYMVSSSIDPVDLDRAGKINEVSKYLIKPINEDDLEEIIKGVEKS